MTSRHMWQVADAGVMLWQPAAPETTLDLTPEEPPETWQILEEEDMQASLGSDHDDEEQAILPSIEGLGFGTYIKDEPVQLYTSQSSSSSIAGSDERGYTRDTPSLIARARSLSSTFSNLLSGIELYAQPETPLRPADEQDIAEFPQSLSDSASSDSETTNYEFAASSPCPGRKLTSPETPIKKHNSNSFNRAASLQRTLNFGMVTSRKMDTMPQTVVPDDRAALVALRSLERDQPHKWDEDERELLVVLNRWYEEATPTSISQAFNAVTGLQLSHRIIRNQFKNYILLYGGRAFPEYQRVMQVPFHDPKGEYMDLHNIIEATVYEFDIELIRREFDIKFDSGKARVAKSPKTRRHYRSLVRRAAEKEQEKLRTSKQPKFAEPRPEPEPEKIVQTYMLGRRTLSSNTEWDHQEVFSDMEEFLDSTIISPGTSLRLPPGTRHIGFRVWDKDSRTFFSEEAGFVSEYFARLWNGDYPSPFSSTEEQGLQALKILTNMHLSLSGGASTFVSVSTSLLQVLVKASTMKEPRIAVIALDHPLLNEPNKTMHAAEILKMLKGDGLAWWAKYKGIAERMVWANVEAATILSHCSLADLEDLSEHNPTCREILNLQCVQPGKRTHFASSQMQL